MRKKEIEYLTEDYSALVLNKKARAELLRKFPPKFSKVIAHHVTIKFNVSKDVPLPKNAVVQVVGYATDNKGIEAAVVSVNGKIQRADGSNYHVTLSLEPGRKPVESNAIVQDYLPVQPFTLECKGEILK